MERHASVDAFIEAQPAEHRALLERVRAVVRAAAPDATERIAYAMPALHLNGDLVYYAVWKGHLGFYPTGQGMVEFADELSAWPCSKGAVQFPLDEAAVPWELITRITQHRAATNRAKPKKKR